MRKMIDYYVSVYIKTHSYHFHYFFHRFVTKRRQYPSTFWIEMWESPLATSLKGPVTRRGGERRRRVSFIFLQLFTTSQRFSNVWLGDFVWIFFSKHIRRGCWKCGRRDCRCGVNSTVPKWTCTEKSVTTIATRKWKRVESWKSELVI